MYLTEEHYNEWYNDMFVAVGEYFPAERSLHTALPPANVRVKNFKTKTMPQYDNCVKEIKARDLKIIERLEEKAD